MSRLNVVCWKWAPRSGYRSSYGPETVNVLHAMVRRHYPALGRFLCVTDDPSGIDAGIEIVTPWNDFADLPSPHGGKNPSCYRRLRAFHPEAGAVFGERFVSLDLDVVVTGDLAPLWDRPEDFVCYGDTNPKTHYNGSMFLLRAGSRPQVWTDFDPRRSPDLAYEAGFFGSDQAWLSYCLGRDEARWARHDGVVSFRNEIRQSGSKELPAGTRVVVFHGELDPWHPFAQARYAWVREHYRGEAVPA
jgi:hypothetical protein